MQEGPKSAQDHPIKTCSYRSSWAIGNGVDFRHWSRYRVCSDGLWTERCQWYWEELKQITGSGDGVVLSRVNKERKLKRREVLCQDANLILARSHRPAEYFSQPQLLSAFPSSTTKDHYRLPFFNMIEISRAAYYANNLPWVTIDFSQMREPLMHEAGTLKPPRPDISPH